MNRRAFLSLVAAAPLAAALKPWRPPAPQVFHVWQIPKEWALLDSEPIIYGKINDTTFPGGSVFPPLAFIGSVAIREGDDISVMSDGSVMVNGVASGPLY